MLSTTGKPVQGEDAVIDRLFLGCGFPYAADRMFHFRLITSIAYRALCCSAFASLLAEESPHILILLTFELLDDALMVNTERSLSLALTSLINNLYEMDATSARFILSSPICQHALHTLLRNHSQSKAVSWFSAKVGSS